MASLSMPIKVVGILTTVLLLIVVNPWFQIPDDQAALRDLVTYGFWLSFIVLLVLLFMERKQPGGETVEIEGPAFTRFLFSNSKAGLFWLPIRLFLGFSWLDAGWHKFTDAAWIGRVRNGPGRVLGTTRSRSRRKVDRPSPTSGIAASCSSSSTTAPRRGSRTSSCSARSPSASGSSSGS